MMFTISLRIVNAVSALAIEIPPENTKRKKNTFPCIRWTWSAKRENQAGRQFVSFIIFFCFIHQFFFFVFFVFFNLLLFYLFRNDHHQYKEKSKIELTEISKLFLNYSFKCVERDEMEKK